MANGRCKLHGGKTPPQATGDANPAYTHGIYTKFFRDDEKALIDAGAIKLGEVDDELKVMRIRLKRALEARERWEAEQAGQIDGEDAETSMALVEVVDGEAPGPEGSTIPISKRTKRLPNFDEIIDKTTGRIESLEKTRKELLKTDSDDGSQDPDAMGRDHVTFTGGLAGDDKDLPTPFAKTKK